MQNWGADMFTSFVNPFPSPGGSGGSSPLRCCCCFTRWSCAQGLVINTRYISNVPAGQEWLTYLIVASLKGHKLGPDFDLGHELRLCDPSGCLGTHAEVQPGPAVPVLNVIISRLPLSLSQLFS